MAGQLGDKVAALQSNPPAVAARGRLLPPRASADGTKRKLLEAALVGFAERGYHGVSTRELAAAAGVRPSSVYAHVSAKEELLHELLVMGHEEHNQAIRRAVLEAGSDPREQMRALVAAHVEVHATYPLLTRVCNHEVHALGPANAVRVLELRADSIRLFREVIERGLERGAFQCDDSWLATAGIAAMGVRVAEWFEPGGPIPVDHVARQYSDFALRMLDRR